ncbi:MULTISPECIES: gluconate 2-dehydrogenase subunit 3 family protein [unclassified Roseitalea]|uniref:gluconate 2-dehydrogenase subunit 3 family protein n=1 Tax=unclassified Roseitalea TaxID=2639107 RepID=UPI00273ED62D|nr:MULTISPECIES: gluconate 2-dehydrogenase subunit 3 family protein [unclassified Roseitalea]
MKFSRRAVLAHIGAAGLSAALPVRSPAQNAYADLEGRPWFFFNDEQARFVAAMVDIFIPEDEFPSASQAGVVDFIDLQLAGPYGRGEGLYLQGPFPESTLPTQGYQLPYPPAELVSRGIEEVEGGQDGIRLVDRDLAGREAFVGALSGTQQSPVAGGFFDEMLKLANWGYFADPIYDGNRDYAGWRMVGFPGAHAYYLSFVDKHNVPYPVDPKGIAHVPGEGPAEFLETRSREG